MDISLERILQLSKLQKMKVLAGEQGLSNSVLWVNVLEMLDELDQLAEGELFVTTAVDLGTSPEAEETLVSRLVQKKISGLAIQTGFYVKEISQTLIRLCDHHGLPLIEIPEEMGFGEIIRAITHEIIYQQNKRLESTQQIQEGMTKLLLEKKGITGIAEHLWELLDCPIKILDSQGYLIADYPVGVTEGFLIDEVGELRANASKRNSEGYFFWRGEIIYPLLVDSAYYGAIWIGESKKANSDQVIALASAATICLLELMKKQEVWEAEERIRGDFLDDLLEGSWAQQEDAFHRGRRLGFDLERPFVMLAIEDKREKGKLPSALERERKKYFHLWIRTLLNEKELQGLIRESQSHVIAFVSLPDEDCDVELVVSSFQTGLSQRMASPISVGVSQVHHGISKLTGSLEEARSALLLGAKLNGEGKTYLYSSFGLYSLFVNSQTNSHLEQYFSETIKPLVEYDKKQKTEFIHTLEVYFSTNLELRETSRQLYIHRHTLSYRLKRIEEITGRSPFNYPDRLYLEVGLLLLPFITREPGTK